jgi:hypothetical protein
MKKIPLGTSLETIWLSIVYTYGRLLYDSRTKHLATQLEPYIAQIEKTSHTQLDCWKAEILSQSKVDGVDVRLDTTVTNHGALCNYLKITDPHGNDRYKRFYEALPPSNVVRMKLEKELKHTQGWDDICLKDINPQMKEYGAKFSILHQEGNEAVAERNKTKTKTKSHRVDEINPLIEVINQTRTNIHIELQKIANQERLGEAWIEGFFRKQRQQGADDPMERRRGAILANLDANEVEIFDEFLERLEQEEDEATLKNWMQKAANATSMEAFLTEIGLSVERKKK